VLLVKVTTAAEAAWVITTVIAAADKAIRIDIEETPKGKEGIRKADRNQTGNRHKPAGKSLILSMRKGMRTATTCHRLMMAQVTVAELPKIRAYFFGVLRPAWMAGGSPSAVPM
jgi:hypothetical protein